MRTADLDMDGDVWVTPRPGTRRSTTASRARSSSGRRARRSCGPGLGPTARPTCSARRRRCGSAGRPAGPSARPGSSRASATGRRPGRRRPRGARLHGRQLPQGDPGRVPEGGRAAVAPPPTAARGGDRDPQAVRPRGVAGHPGARGRAGDPDLRRGGPEQGGRGHAADRVKKGWRKVHMGGVRGGRSKPAPALAPRPNSWCAGHDLGEMPLEMRGDTAYDLLTDPPGARPSRDVVHVMRHRHGSRRRRRHLPRWRDGQRGTSQVSNREVAIRIWVGNTLGLDGVFTESDMAVADSDGVD